MDLNLLLSTRVRVLRALSQRLAGFEPAQDRLQRQVSSTEAQFSLDAILSNYRRDENKMSGMAACKPVLWLECSENTKRAFRPTECPRLSLFHFIHAFTYPTASSHSSPLVRTVVDRRRWITVRISIIRAPIIRTAIGVITTPVEVRSALVKPLRQPGRFLSVHRRDGQRGCQVEVHPRLGGNPDPRSRSSR